jgi:hypothetical protein
MSKNVAGTEGPQMTSQYGAYMLHAKKARLQARTHVHMPKCPGTHMHACTHAHRPISNNYCFSMAMMICKRASMLCYMYSACLVNLPLRHYEGIISQHSQYTLSISLQAFKAFRITGFRLCVMPPSPLHHLESANLSLPS